MVVVSAEHVQKRFRAVVAIGNLSFEVRRGEIFALRGPNGAGKTTTVRLLLGLIRPDAGRIRWRIDGHEAPPASRDVG
jgi:ABC-type multidrug transport system ATPase subunit